jgi:hypothetical protein
MTGSSPRLPFWKRPSWWYWNQLFLVAVGAVVAFAVHVTTGGFNVPTPRQVAQSAAALAHYKETGLRDPYRRAPRHEPGQVSRGVDDQVSVQGWGLEGIRRASKCLGSVNHAVSRWARTSRGSKTAMRLRVLGCALVAAVVAPSAAPAHHLAPGDGTLVVQKGSAPVGVPVVTLIMKGTLVGRLSSGSPDQLDTVVIDQLQGTGQFNADASAGARLDTKDVTSTRTQYAGSDFRFRAVDPNSFRVTIYGSGINVFAVGQGKATLQGLPNQTLNTGRYSLQGQPFQPLPAAPTAWLPLTAVTGPPQQAPPTKITPH